MTYDGLFCKPEFLAEISEFHDWHQIAFGGLWRFGGWEFDYHSWFGWLSAFIQSEFQRQRLEDCLPLRLELVG